MIRPDLARSARERQVTHSSRSPTMSLALPESWRRFPLSPSEGERVGERGSSLLWGSGAQSASKWSGCSLRGDGGIQNMPFCQTFETLPARQPPGPGWPLLGMVLPWKRSGFAQGAVQKFSILRNTPKSHISIHPSPEPDSTLLPCYYGVAMVLPWCSMVLLPCASRNSLILLHLRRPFRNGPGT